MNRTRTLQDNIEFYTTFIVSILLVIFSILDLFGVLDNIKWFKGHIPTLILLSVGAIGLYLALERRGKLDEISSRLHPSELDLMHGKEPIYAKSIDILKRTKDRLWISALNLEATPENWFIALEKSLKDNPDLEIRRVIGISDLDDLEKAEKFLDRFKQYRNMLVGAYVNLPYEGVHDYFISDEHVVGLGIAEKFGVAGLTSCIWITETSVIRSLIEWYANRLWQQARKIKTHKGIDNVEMTKIKAEVERLSAT